MPLSELERRRLHQRAPSTMREATVADPPLTDEDFLRVELDGAPGVIHECPWPRGAHGQLPVEGDGAAIVESDGGNLWAVAWWPAELVPDAGGGGPVEVTQAELDAAVATLTTAIGAKQDAATAATDAELAAAVGTINTALAAKQDAATAATDAELAANATADRARANHTGTQLAATISDFAAADAVEWAKHKKPFTVGDGIATSFSVSHNLNTQEVVWSVRDAATNVELFPEVTPNTVNTLVLDFGETVRAANSVKVVVIG